MEIGALCLFKPRKRRMARFGKYAGLPVEVRYVNEVEGTILVFANDGQSRFSAYPDELTVLDKPIHGSPRNYTFDNKGNLK